MSFWLLGSISGWQQKYDGKDNNDGDKENDVDNNDEYKAIQKKCTPDEYKGDDEYHNAEDAILVEMLNEKQIKVLPGGYLVLSFDKNTLNDYCSRLEALKAC